MSLIRLVALFALCVKPANGNLNKLVTVRQRLQTRLADTRSSLISACALTLKASALIQSLLCCRAEGHERKFLT